MLLDRCVPIPASFNGLMDVIILSLELNRLSNVWIKIVSDVQSSSSRVILPSFLPHAPLPPPSLHKLKSYDTPGRNCLRTSKVLLLLPYEFWVIPPSPPHLIVRFQCRLSLPVILPYYTILLAPLGNSSGSNMDAANVKCHKGIFARGLLTCIITHFSGLNFFIFFIDWSKNKTKKLLLRLSFCIRLSQFPFLSILLCEVALPLYNTLTWRCLLLGHFSCCVYENCSCLLHFWCSFSVRSLSLHMFLCVNLTFFFFLIIFDFFFLLPYSPLPSSPPPPLPSLFAPHPPRLGVLCYVGSEWHFPF